MKLHTYVCDGCGKREGPQGCPPIGWISTGQLSGGKVSRDGEFCLECANVAFQAIENLRPQVKS